jgi:hypothetical protein
MRLVGGYNYIIGSSVYHDPEFSADVLTIDTQSFQDPFVFNSGNFPILSRALGKILPLVLGIVVLSVVLMGVAASKSRREQAPVPSEQQYVPSGAWASDDDWSQYKP